MNSKIRKLAVRVKVAADKAARWPDMGLTAAAVADGKKRLAISRLLAALGCAQEAEELASQADVLLAQRAASRAWRRLHVFHKNTGLHDGDEVRENAAAEAAKERAATLSLLARRGTIGIQAGERAAICADKKHEEVLVKGFPGRSL